MMKTKLGLGLVLVAVLAGCGGGGGGDAPATTPSDTSGAPSNTAPTNSLSQVTVRAVLPAGDGYYVTSVEVAMWAGDRMYQGSMLVNGSEATLVIGDVIPGVYNLEVKGYEVNALILGWSGQVDVSVNGDVNVQTTLITKTVNMHIFWPGVTELNGTYQGMKNATSCGAGTFTTSSSDFTIAINGSTIAMEQNAFFDGVCKFDGTFTEENNLLKTASGTVKCSNFDEGTWSSNMIRSTSDNSMIASIDVSIPARACDYTVTHIGFLK